MTATVAGIHLGPGTHAARPAANTAPDGSHYSCLDHGLIYKSTYASNAWATWAILGDPPGTAAAAVAAEITARNAAVAAAVAALVNSAPAALDTLNELAAALGNDANYAATISAALAGKQPLDSDLTAIAALTTTAYGRSLLALADAAALRALAGVEVAPPIIWVGPPSNTYLGGSNAMVINRVYTQWFFVPQSLAVTKANVIVNVQSGNLCVALIDAAKNRLATTGSVACPVGGLGQNLALAAGLTLLPGVKYGASVEVDNTTVRLIGNSVAGSAQLAVVALGLGGSDDPGVFPIPATLGVASSLSTQPVVWFS